MTKTINATEAVRTFSELLNAVKYRGDRYTIVRGGKPVAAVVPVEEDLGKRKLGELRSILDALPRLDDDAEAFSRDVEGLIAGQPVAPESPAWE